MKTNIRVDNTAHELSVDSRLTLLDALRDVLGLTGTKKGCDQGACGACTVIIDGQRVLSCLTLAAAFKAQHVVTIEGLANSDELHPMQAPFLHCDATSGSPAHGLRRRGEQVLRSWDLMIVVGSSRPTLTAS